jgi:hypothetical protein
MRSAAPWMLLFSLLVGCRHQVEPPDPLGEGEGEGDGGEGEGEGEGEGDPCAGPAVIGLIVPVEDNTTRFRICGATVQIQDGLYNETLVQRGSTQEDCEYVGANDRPGTYEIQAAAAGYTPFNVSNITVQAETECNKPITRTVTLRLNPS